MKINQIHVVGFYSGQVISLGEYCMLASLVFGSVANERSFQPTQAQLAQVCT